MCGVVWVKFGGTCFRVVLVMTFASLLLLLLIFLVSRTRTGVILGFFVMQGKNKKIE